MSKETPYERVFSELATKRGKTLNGYEMSTDAMAGTISWTKGDKEVMATPFWDDNKAIPVELFDDHGEQKYFNKVDAQEDYDLLQADKMGAGVYAEKYFMIMERELNSVESTLNK